MNIKQISQHSALRSPWKPFSFLAIGIAASLSAQTDLSDDEEVFDLSPFQVDASDDSGYRATNTISGTRLNAAIKDIPMPIEVVTEAFMEDTGATDLRDALAYSAGITLSSQNDAGANNSFNTVGGVHNAEGATSNKNQTTYKVRGFITDATLRDGYRRQYSTDSANVGRVEVIRGPAALLYGIGNFGGIVNYLPKSPPSEAVKHLNVTVGNDKHGRVVLEGGDTFHDNPLRLGYYVTAVYEENGSYTEFAEGTKSFVSPIFTLHPTEKTEITIDLEYGKERNKGVGFQSVRARADVASENIADQQDRQEKAGFLQFPDKNIRSMRWSGPDTFVNSEGSNGRFQITHSFADNLNVLLGYNVSQVDFETRDVRGGLTNNVGPVGLRSTIEVIPADVENGDSEFQVGLFNDAIFQGYWEDKTERVEREQIRAELNYTIDLFSGSELFGLSNSFLLGRSNERSDMDVFTRATLDNQFFFWDPSDSSPMRFGVNGDGTSAPPLDDFTSKIDTSWNQGTYLVYQGKWLNDRATFVGGIRRDRNDTRSRIEDFREDTVTTSLGGVQSDDTAQMGISFEVTNNISVYALQAEGIMPNFEGKLDIAGNPMDAVTAESEEAGVKFDFLDGKLSGTVSAYRIKQTGTPVAYWWAPAPAKGNFDRDADIIYNVTGFNPDANPWSAGQVASTAQWQAAIAAGATSTIGDQLYLNATNPAGAAYLDAVFANKVAWPGWLYGNDANTNNATMDFASPDASGYFAHLSGDQESSGWEAQINYAPTDNMQFVLNYAQTKRTVVNAGAFPEFEWGAGGFDRWAVWYFQDGGWGLSGFPLEEAYSNPIDTSTWQGRGYGAGEAQDDTPLHAVSGWGSYRFDDGKLAGLSFGLGFQYESEREYFSGITDGGQLVVDTEGRRVILETDPRINIDAMAKYEFQVKDRNAHLQLNIYNLMNDQDAYGYLYAKPTQYRLQFGIDI